METKGNGECMANLHIFTAGTSLLSNLEFDPTGNAHYTWLLTWLKGRDIPRIINCPEENLEAFRRMYTFYCGKTGKETTAELASFLKLELMKDDLVVLLTSDTPEGLFSALVNAHLMANGNSPEPVYLWEEPGISTQIINWNTSDTCQGKHEILVDNQREKVHIMRIPGLDPTSASGFTDQAVGNLVRAVANLVKYARGHALELDPIIVFTGGFKVSLPVLTQAASWLGGVPMVGLHEDSDKLIYIPLLGTAVDDHTKRAILGWAWKHNRNLSQLTDFYRKVGEQNKLSNWSRATDMSFDELDKEIKPLFTSSGSGVALNILGEALLAVIMTNLPIDI